MHGAIANAKRCLHAAEHSQKAKADIRRRNTDEQLTNCSIVLHQITFACRAAVQCIHALGNSAENRQLAKPHPTDPTAQSALML